MKLTLFSLTLGLAACFAAVSLSQAITNEPVRVVSGECPGDS